MKNVSFGTLYLIPSPLGPGAIATIPAATRETVIQLRVFALETGKVGRAFLKELGLPLRDCEYYEIDKRAEDTDRRELIDVLKSGKDVGLVSDAGAPGVADPGAGLVRLAHAAGVRVVPLVGPSAILMSIMAAGMNGQSFSFHGYLSPKRPALAKDLKRLEAASRKGKGGSTQIWIEAPYRNRATVETALETLQPTTLFGVACDLTLPTEFVRTARVADWDAAIGASLHKRPAMFLLIAM